MAKRATHTDQVRDLAMAAFGFFEDVGKLAGVDSAVIAKMQDAFSAITWAYQMKAGEHTVSQLRVLQTSFEMYADQVGAVEYEHDEWQKSEDERRENNKHKCVDASKDDM